MARRTGFEEHRPDEWTAAIPDDYTAVNYQQYGNLFEENPLMRSTGPSFATAGPHLALANIGNRVVRY